MFQSAIIPALCLIAFAAVHSLTASLPFKRMVVRKLGPRVEPWYLHAYNILSFLTIAPLVYVLYKDPGPLLYTVPSPWRWFMVAGQLLAGYVGIRALLDARNRFEVRGQLATPGSPEAGHMDVRGVYRWVRDPFTFSGLIVMWLTPFMTENLLVVYLLTTVYLCLGSVHAESRLVAQFGDEYRDYQKKVRRLIPGAGMGKNES